MIDSALLRKSPEKVLDSLCSRNERYKASLEAAIKMDSDHRALLQEVEALRAKRNALSQSVGKAKASGAQEEAQKLLEEVGRLKLAMEEKEKSLEVLVSPLREALLSLPNLPHESVPRGKNEEDNRSVRFGQKPGVFDFKPLDHQTIGENLGILDFAAAAKLSGSRFALWRGLGSRLMGALVSFTLDLHHKAGYEEIWPPYLVKPEILEGTGQLPKFKEDLYHLEAPGKENSQTAGDMYLIPTAEVPLTNLVRDEILSAENLPIKMTAYTPCFRQEAGSYGKDVRGLIRNHQFDKVELVWITKPEDSLEALESLTKDAEKVLATLEIPYRIIELCTGDIGFAARKTYDLEVWMPSEQKYREISSCSDCGDFQARRMNARFRRAPKNPPELVHTLNGSGVAIGRLFAAILENFQQKDGSVLLPKALVPYAGFERLMPKGVNQVVEAKKG